VDNIGFFLGLMGGTWLGILEPVGILKGIFDGVLAGVFDGVLIGLPGVLGVL